MSETDIPQVGGLVFKTFVSLNSRLESNKEEEEVASGLVRAYLDLSIKWRVGVCAPAVGHTESRAQDL